MLAILKNKQILYLFLSSFAVLFIGMGLFPILPLYVAEFQASNSLIGLYYACIYSAFALGPAVAGGLIARFSKRLVFILGSLVAIPALFFLGSAHNLVQVFVLTSFIWFSGGLLIAVISIFTGLHTDANSRGKAYSLMAMAAPLGALVGGASIGRLVAWHGYPVMFKALALVWSAIPLIGWLLLKETVPVKAKAAAKAAARISRSRSGSAAGLGGAFGRVMTIAFLGSLAVNVGRLGTSLSMHSEHFPAQAVSGVAVLSGLVAIPFTLAIGTLSDRLGRKHFLFVSYLFMTSSALILANVSALWQYQLAAILNMLAFSVSGAMTQALASEVVPHALLDRGLARANIISAVANIVSFAIGGALFDRFGLTNAFLLVAVLALAGGAAIESFRHPAAPAPDTDCRALKEACTNEN